MSFLTELNNLTPLGVIALLGLVIYYLVKNKGLPAPKNSIEKIEKNHLHEIKETLGRIERFLIENNRLTNEINNNITWVKARLNGQR